MSRTIQSGEGVADRSTLWMAIVFTLALITIAVAALIANSLPGTADVRAPSTTVQGPAAPALTRADDYALRHSAATSVSAPTLTRLDDYGTRHAPVVGADAGQGFNGDAEDFALRHPELFRQPALTRNDDYGTRHAPTD